MTTRRNLLGPLGETELEILNLVWALKEGTVSEVRERILEDREVAYTTVQTVMNNLTKKGYLEHSSKGKSFVYRAVKPASEVRSNILRDLVQRVFMGSHLELVQALVRDEDLTDEELAEIIAEIRPEKKGGKIDD
jgi:BlaI family penicillinase repressor